MGESVSGGGKLSRRVGVCGAGEEEEGPASDSAEKYPSGVSSVFPLDNVPACCATGIGRPGGGAGTVVDTDSGTSLTLGDGLALLAALL